MSTDDLPKQNVNSYDFIIVGGGTAGCVIANRLTEYLPEKKVLVIEGGPSDVGDMRVLDLKNWINLLESDFDHNYGTTEQPMGNSHIRHSRAKVLGGCSSMNTLISFRPFEYDARRWMAKGCEGWDFNLFTRMADRIKNTFQPVAPQHRNQLCRDWIQSCSSALDIPVVENFNSVIRTHGSLSPSVGFFNISYNPEDGTRSSASVAYLHPILKGKERRPNLTVLTNAWVDRIHIAKDNSTVTGVNVILKSGELLKVTPKCETILCAGAIDTPRLMLLSGLGPKTELESLGIKCVHDIPGVGENLIDHPESIIMWELSKPVPEDQTTMDSDGGVFLRREHFNANGDDGAIVDVMMHCYQIPFNLNTDRLGYDSPPDRYAFCMTPNIPRPRSRGKLYLVSSDPRVKPALDFRYFTDPEGYDAATLVAGIKAARKVAEKEPFRDWIKREVAPGPECQTDEEISEFARRAAHTVYHPSGTTKMGNVKQDVFAVVDPQLRVRGVKNLRISDAGVFPEIPSVNPMLTVLSVGERTAECIAECWGYKGRQLVQLAKL